MQLKDGFGVGAGACFEATIAYDGRYGGNSDCDNINYSEIQTNRTAGGGGKGALNNGSTATAPSPKSNAAGTNASSQSTGFSIYPNPAQNEVTISGISNMNKIEILNATMQTVSVVEGNQNKVDVSALAGGMYFLKIYAAGNKKIFCKFIKQ